MKMKMKIKMEIERIEQEGNSMVLDHSKIRDERNKREKDDVLKGSDGIIRDQGDKLSKAEIAIDVLGDDLAS